MSVERAFAAVKRADIVVMVVDAGQGITEQDFKLAEYASQQVSSHLRGLHQKACTSFNRSRFHPVA